MNTQTPRSRHFQGFSTQDNTNLQEKNNKTITKTVHISPFDIQTMLDLYRWRAETQFPIAKIKTIEILPSEHQAQNHQQNRPLSVSFEELTFSLADVDNAPLFRMLYLLKQTLIGLERLFTKFGSFFFTERMVFVNQLGKCKVWINEQVQINQFYPNGLSESQFLAHVFWMFKKKTTESKQSAAFYEGIKICNSFFSALEYLESFVERQKIKVLTYFKVQASSNGATSLQKKKKKTDLNMTMSKKPKFLVNMEFNSSRDESLTSPKKDIFASSKFIPTKNYFSKMEMKISGDTAAESEKNIKSSNDCGGFSPVMYSRKALKEKELFNSDKSERVPKKGDVGRKFSQTNQQSSPVIEIHGPKEFLGPNSQKDILNEISQSMIFDEVTGKTSRSSSGQNKERLIEKKKEVFNCNGWQLKVNSLFSNDSQIQKSYIDNNAKQTVRRQPIKLELLDKCATNMCQSFMGGEE